MARRQLWRWRGLDSQGESKTGALWAESQATALFILEEESIVPLRLWRGSIRKALWQSQYSCEIMQQLATLLQAGLTLSESLSLLARQHPHPQWQALLQHISRQLAQGISLSASLKAWPEAFTPLYQAMIHAGELTGKLDYCCLHLARQQAAQQLLNKKVKKALRYPTVILTLALLIVIGMSGFVLPEFAEIYRTFNTPLPALTRYVIAISAGVQHGLPLIIASFVLMIPGWLLLRRSARWHKLRPKIALALPLFSDLIRGQKLTQIYTVLSLTQHAGLPFLQGLESVEQTMTCPWWRNLIHQIAKSITEGRTLWQALEGHSVFTPLCRQLIRTGETSGALDGMLENLAHHHEEQTSQLAENLASLLEPAMLLITGIIIGTLVVAMYLPIFNLGEAMSSVG